MPERHASQADADHWSTYWARGVLTSLPDDFRANYDGEIARFWHALFADLPDPAEVLDACTGNGALALLAASFARDHDRAFRITAVDAARIQPRRAAAEHAGLESLLERIRFVDRTPLERFDSEPARFDLVASQYGLEYCDPAVVGPRLAAMLKPGGRLAMLCHALESDMLATMRGEADEYRLLDELNIPRLLGAWLSGQLASADFRRRLERAGRDLMTRHQRKPSPLYSYALAMIRHVGAVDEAGLKASRGALADARAQLVSGRARLEDMLAANRLMADPDWHHPYREAGLELVDDAPLRYRQRHHVGHYYVFVRPG
ncbi:MAG: class I SAM-dependent methyltransferase [Wenzhouxiangella sp.]|nr:MAG: class I SAM-dependent methyltransferase [Wenzhouxiangella sp.]